jgi:hemerythrin superfamily protein
MLKTIARKLDPAPDAVSLLEADHRKVDALFTEFEDGRGRARTATVEQICKELEIHAKIEEKIFYPQAKKVVRDEINEGLVEHETLKRLVGELQRMSAADEMFEPRVKALKEYVKHHVHEEESKVFPAVVESELDLKALGEQLQAEKERLQRNGSQSRTPARSRAKTARSKRGNVARRSRARAKQSGRSRSRGRSARG